MFTGREYLDTIQLYDYRNRTYSPKWGRFIEVDPIRFEGGDLNLYRYVSNWVMELIRGGWPLQIIRGIRFMLSMKKTRRFILFQQVRLGHITKMVFVIRIVPEKYSKQWMVLMQH